MADNTEIAIQTTVMALREQLMEYFKGTCIERFTENTNIRFINASTRGRANFSYLRREAENQRPMIVMLGGLPIMTVQRAPEVAVFHATLLTRSPQLRQVYQELKVFMDKYLGGVETKHSRKGVIYANK